MSFYPVDAFETRNNENVEIQLEEISIPVSGFSRNQNKKLIPVPCFLPSMWMVWISAFSVLKKLFPEWGKVSSEFQGQIWNQRENSIPVHIFLRCVLYILVYLVLEKVGRFQGKRKLPVKFYGQIPVQNLIPEQSSFFYSKV